MLEKEDVISTFFAPHQFEQALKDMSSQFADFLISASVKEKVLYSVGTNTYGSLSFINSYFDAIRIVTTSTFKSNNNNIFNLTMQSYPAAAYETLHPREAFHMRYYR